MLASSSAEWYSKYASKMEYPENSCLHDRFREAAAKYPQRIALVDGNFKLTFRELDEQSDKLSLYLRGAGIRVGEPVGILMERSWQFILCAIAILKAGGAYSPLEVAYPPQLLNDVLQDMKPKVILSKAKYSSKLPQSQHVLYMDEGWDESQQFADMLAVKDDGKDKPTPDTAAYFVYSSGTTGKPKGIICPHRGAVHSYHWEHVNNPFVESDRAGCNVFFMWECLRPLFVGAPTYVVPDDVIYDPRRLAHYIEDNQITRILFTPSLMATILSVSPDQVDLKTAFRSVRIIRLCGEVVSLELRDAIVKLWPNVQVVNLYSISECHDVSQEDLSLQYSDDLKEMKGDYSSCGYVMSNVEVDIVDPDTQELVKAGEPGNVYVAGPTVAIGYLNRPDTTAKRFFQYRGRRVYFTGDRGVLHTNGKLEILGRCDSMVKIRGYSVVLDLVESKLFEHNLIAKVLCVTEGPEGGDKQLVAFLELAKDNEDAKISNLNCQLLYEFLDERLPFYAIPSIYVVLDELPLSPTTGKANKKALPKLADVDPSRLLSTPRKLIVLEELTSIERKLLNIWTELLSDGETGHVGLEDNFFVLGGHSLSAARLLSMVEEEFGVVLPVAILFQEEHATIQGLSKLIEGQIGGDSVKPSLIVSSATLTKEEMKTECILEDSISFCFEERKVGDSKAPRAIFLTGATGFLGSKVIHSLLRRNAYSTKIYCLVRLSNAEYEKPNAVAAAQRRLLNIISRSGYRYNKIQDKRRLIAVPGSLSLDMLGMRKNKYDTLVSELAEYGDCAFINCGAKVNLVLPYSSLANTNVKGTERIIRIASRVHQLNGGRTNLFHISTLGVFPSGRDRKDTEISVTGPVDELADGYGQTKLVAEHLMLEAEKRGANVFIIRPGNMAGDTLQGVWNQQDFYYLLLASCLHIGAFPRLPDFKVEWTPVDMASKIIARLLLLCTEKTLNNDWALDPADRGDLSKGYLRSFHVVNEKKKEWCFIVDALEEEALNAGLLRKGDTFDRLLWKDWLQRARSVTQQTIPQAPQSENEPKTGHEVTEMVCTMVGDFSSADEFMNGVFAELTAENAVTQEFINNGFESNALLQTYILRHPEIDSLLIQSYLQTLGHFIVSPAAYLLGGRNDSSQDNKASAKKLQGKLAVVTGASQGIGAAIAQGLAAEGAFVVIAARNKDKLEAVQTTIRNDGGKCLSIPTDVTDLLQVRKCVTLACQVANQQGVDILVNCAGVMPFHLMKHCNVDEWNWIVKVNCNGVMNGCAAVIPGMMARKTGHIVNISSDAGRKVFPALAVYSASKHFVEAVSRGIRSELANDGYPIKVTCIQPGDVKTELALTTTDQEAMDNFGSYLKDPNIQIMKPEDIANAVVYSVTQPPFVAINEILVEPTSFPI